MKRVEPKVFVIGSTEADQEGLRAWLDHIGEKQTPVPDAGSGGATVIACAAKRCYMAFSTNNNKNLTRVREDMVEYLDNILKVGHGSVCEHATYNFAIEGVSRVWTAEMNRHRAGWAISEGSMRFIRYEEIPFWKPDSLIVEPTDSPELIEAKLQTWEVFEQALKQDEQNYAELERIWSIDSLKEFKVKKKLTSMFRRIIPIGIATGGVWTGNIRAIRHVLAMRLDPAAEEEMIHVFTKVLFEIQKREPVLFGDFDVDGKPKYWKV